MTTKFHVKQVEIRKGGKGLMLGVVYDIHVDGQVVGEGRAPRQWSDGTAEAARELFRKVNEELNGNAAEEPITLEDENERIRGIGEP